MAILFSEAHKVTGFSGSQNPSMTAAAVAGVSMPGVAHTGVAFADGVADYTLSSYTLDTYDFTNTSALSGTFRADSSGASATGGGVMSGNRLVPDGDNVGGLCTAVIYLTTANGECVAAGTDTSYPFSGTITGRTQTVDAITYDVGSLAAHITDNVSAMIAGKSTGATNQAHYGVNNYSTASPNATLNSASILSGYDVAAISVARTGDGAGGPAFPAELISTNHCVTAWHIGAETGDTITWRDNTGTYHTRTLANHARIASSDITIGYFTTPITAIAPLKLLPDGYATKLASAVASTTSNSINHRTPAIVRKAHDASSNSAAWWFITSVHGMTDTNIHNAGIFGSGPQPHPLFTAWSDAIESGDSGSPTLMPINGDLVLLGVQSTDDGITPPRYSGLAALGTVMDTLAGAAAGTFVPLVSDLSGFTSYA